MPLNEFEFLLEPCSISIKLTSAVFLNVIQTAWSSIDFIWDIIPQVWIFWNGKKNEKKTKEMDYNSFSGIGLSFLDGTRECIKMIDCLDLTTRYIFSRNVNYFRTFYFFFFHLFCAFIVFGLTLAQVLSKRLKIFVRTKYYYAKNTYQNWEHHYANYRKDYIYQSEVNSIISRHWKRIYFHSRMLRSIRKEAGKTPLWILIRIQEGNKKTVVS